MTIGLLASIALVSCAGGGGSSEAAVVPDGWESEQVEELRFALPSDYGSADADVTDPEADASFSRGDGTPLGSDVVALYSASSTSDGGTEIPVEVHVAEISAMATLQLQDFEITAHGEVEVPGAVEARAWQWRYVEPQPDAEFVLDVLVVRTDDRILDLRHIRAEDDDRGFAEQLFATVEVVD